jgi:Uma2 family endonuclease
MDIVAPKHISETSYLARERQSEEKYEYEDGKLIPMGGASLAHNNIVSNLMGLLWLYSREADILVHANDMRVYIPESARYYYPDLVITEGKPQLLDDDFDTLTNPAVLIEVLSASTSSRDRGPKFEAYRSITSLKEYLLVSQDQAKLEGYYKNDQGAWVIRESVIGQDATFSFQHFELSLPLKTVYQKVDFSKAEKETNSPKGQ